MSKSIVAVTRGIRRPHCDVRRPFRHVRKPNHYVTIHAGNKIVISENLSRIGGEVEANVGAWMGGSWEVLYSGTPARSEDLC